MLRFGRRLKMSPFKRGLILKVRHLSVEESRHGRVVGSSDRRKGTVQNSIVGGTVTDRVKA